MLTDAASGRPIFQVFGPVTVKTGSVWASVLAEVFPDPNARPIVQSTDLLNGNDPILEDGSYLWPGWNLFDKAATGAATTTAHVSSFNQAFYTKATANSWNPIFGGAYPRFKDYYADGAAPGAALESWWGVDLRALDGAVYDQCFTDARNNGAQFVQIATLNDWQEGTVIEPSYEEGFKWLLQTQQQLTGTTNLAALEARVREYNQLKASTWRHCDAVAVADRVPCPGSSISTSATQCESELGCCWRETSTAGAPWCFQRATTPIETCPPPEIRDCEAQPLDRLCLCKHDLDPSPPPPTATTPTTSTTLANAPWWVIIVAALAGVGAAAIVCVGFLCCCVVVAETGPTEAAKPPKGGRKQRVPMDDGV